MSITKENKKEIISKFAINKKDTGSAEVQIAVISERINTLLLYPISFPANGLNNL